jgi:2-polyprenyl-6-methoxyphenol hydroxylase-like FAD-dependent oxidoreductase
MQGRLRIAIVGYGAAGQSTALFLSAQGHALSVFEQAAEPGPVGAGFLLQPTGLGVLARLGLHDQALAVGQRIARLQGSTHRGRCVMDMKYVDHAPDCFGLGMTRGSLFTLMRDAYAGASRMHTGVRIASVDMQANRVMDSTGIGYGPFDLIIVADGAHSSLRASAPTLVRRAPVYPWGAMWCLVPAENWPHHDTLQQRYGRAREMIGLLPVGRRADQDGRWLTFFFSLPGVDVEAFDTRSLARLRERVDALWPEALPLLSAIHSPEQLQRARYRDVVLHRPTHGCVVFIGDAAHAMSPQLGQGVNMALMDSAALADSLSEHATVEQALADYARLRQSHVAVYQRLSRWMTPLFQSDHDGLAWLRDMAFGPLGRLSLTRGTMLKVLTGTKMRWWR